VLSELLEAPALQIDRELEEGDSLRAADRPTAGYHPAGCLDLLQELRKHCRRETKVSSSALSYCQRPCRMLCKTKSDQIKNKCKNAVHQWLNKSIHVPKMP